MYDRILVTPLKMHPRYSQSSRENATLFINTNYYKILGKSLGNSM